MNNSKRRVLKTTMILIKLFLVSAAVIKSEIKARSNICCLSEQRIGVVRPTVNTRYIVASFASADNDATTVTGTSTIISSTEVIKVSVVRSIGVGVAYRFNRSCFTLSCLADHCDRMPLSKTCIDSIS